MSAIRDRSNDTKGSKVSANCDGPNNIQGIRTSVFSDISNDNKNKVSANFDGLTDIEGIRMSGISGRSNDTRCIRTYANCVGPIDEKI